MAGSIIPLRGIRGVIAQKMSESLQAHAQLSYTATVDMTNILDARARLKAAEALPRLEDLLIFSVARALQKHPDHNGTTDGKQANLSEAVHLGVAIATKVGLMVPVIRDAESKSLEDISIDRRNLVKKAMVGKLTVSDMTGATFTISNLGQTRVETFTPIISMPQIAILGIGCMTSTLVRSEAGEIVERPIMSLSLTADHRVVDGWPSGQFLSTLCNTIETFTLSGDPCCVLSPN